MFDAAFIRRIAIAQAAIVALGLVAFFVLERWIGVVSFGAGALVASLSYWVIVRFVSGIGSDRVGAVSLLLTLGRLLLAAALLYVILQRYEVSFVAAGCGVFTPVAAILTASTLEFFYARTP